MSEGSEKVALLGGSSGMVGALLMSVLLESPEYVRVHALSRRPLPLDHPRLANRIVRFEALESQLTGLRCDDAFCCLGSTMGQAGSQSAFRAVDFDLVLRFARVAAAAGATRFVFLSSAGANPAAKSFYLRIKGEAEQALEAVGFRALDLLQPSLLLGSRRELRLLETLAQLTLPVLNPLLLGRNLQWRAVSARTVAAAMRGAARSARRGVHRYTYEGIRALALQTSRETSRL